MIKSVEEQDIKQRLDNFTRKISCSEAKHREFIDQRVEDLRRRNNSINDVNLSWKEQRQQEMEKIFALDSQRQKVQQKRLQRTYKDMFQMWQDFKEKRKAQFDFNLSRLGDENDSR